MFSACKGDGLKKNVTTVSERVQQHNTSKIRNIDIQPSGLISTTNTEGINKSTNIIKTNDNIPNENKRRLSFKAIRSSLKLNTSLKYSKRINKDSDNNSVCNTPETAETTVSTPDSVAFINVKKLALQYDNQSVNTKNS